MSVNNAALTLIKYGDNIALTGRLKGEITLFQRYQRIEQLSYWFGKSFLELSVGKTKGLVCSNRRREVQPEKSVSIHRRLRLLVHLSILIHRKLAFSENKDHVYKKSTVRIISSQKIEKLQR